MSDSLPNVVCLCPTYGRPSVVANAAACFAAQDYPLANRLLFVFDDAGQILKTTPANREKHEKHGIVAMSSSRRRGSLPEKYDEMIRAVGGWADIFVVWDDDDVYLPWHVRMHVRALAGVSGYVDGGGEGDTAIFGEGGDWSQPESVYSTYTGKVAAEDSRGRFHGSLAMRSEFLNRIGGWTGVMPVARDGSESGAGNSRDVKRADFDPRMIAACAASGKRGHYSMVNGPGYVYRWGDSGATHCSGMMTSPDNRDWYDKVRPCERVEQMVDLVPRFDRRTVEIYRECAPNFRTDEAIGYEKSGVA